MKTVLLFILSFVGSLLFGQGKGAQPLVHTPLAEEGKKIYAVVVGISDYQTPQIPDLLYADQDALAFVDWLKSPAGGKLHPENILLLLNEAATVSRVSDALSHLIEVCKEGDLAIIYFSGHGDVESRLKDQWGFLLCYDSPARTYIAGACPVHYIQSLISTLTIENQSRVLFIADACHAGKLAGSKINGSQLTNANLSQQFSNEMKILSCQSNEFSIEGKQWGGGRGVFSWFLIEGLNGIADADEDLQISLMEIGRYLEENVPRETSPHQQIPVIVGDKSAFVASVDTQQNKKPDAYGEDNQYTQTLSAINIRGLERGLLEPDDSLIAQAYRQFLDALESKHLMYPEKNSANELLNYLITQQSIKPLHNLLRRNLAIALQDEVQQAINALLDDDPFEFNAWTTNSEKYQMYPAYLGLASELIGKKSIFYPILESKRLFFEAYLILQSMDVSKHERSFVDSLRVEAYFRLRKSLALEPNAPYVFNSLARSYYLRIPCMSDSAAYFNQKAIELAPNWLTPVFETGFEYLGCHSDACKAEPWIRKAFTERPDSYLAQLNMSWLLQWKSEIPQSKAICQKLMETRPDLFNAYATLAITSGKIEGDFTEALKYAQRAIELEPGAGWHYEGLAIGYNGLGQWANTLSLLEGIFSKAQPLYQMIFSAYIIEALCFSGQLEKGLAMAQNIFDKKQSIYNFYQILCKFWQGRILLKMNRVEEAKQVFQEIFEMDKTNNGIFISAWAWIGQCHSLQSNFEEAERHFQKAIDYRFCGDGMDTPGPREEAHYLYGKFLMEQDRMKEAQYHFEKAKMERPFSYWGDFGSALLAGKKGLEIDCLSSLESALKKGFPYVEEYTKSALLKNLIRTPAFKKMLAAYK